MEFKVIIYIIAGIVYFVYSFVKKANENKEVKKPASSTPDKQETTPTVRPPVANPMDDILREIKRKQAEAEAKKRALAQQQQPKPLTRQATKQPPKDILIHQKQKGVFEEGNYERDLTLEEKIERGKLKIENEGIYTIKSVEEMEKEEAAGTFEFDIRNAIVGSVILERKY